MSPFVSTFLFELVNFLLLAWLVGWLLFKPVRAMLEGRQAEAKRLADELAEKTKQAEGLQVDWQQRHAALEQELTATRTSRLAAAEREAAAIIDRARQTAENERQRTARTLGHVERAQAERLAEAVAAASRDAVASLLASLDAPDLESGLVRAACRQIDRLGPGALGDVLVESAGPLADADRSVLVAALGPAAGTAEFRVVPPLGAGLRVTTARGLIDASAAGIAAEAGRRLKGQLDVSEEEGAKTT